MESIIKYVWVDKVQNVLKQIYDLLYSRVINTIAEPLFYGIILEQNTHSKIKRARSQRM